MQTLSAATSSAKSAPEESPTLKVHTAPEILSAIVADRKMGAAVLLALKGASTLYTIAAALGIPPAELVSVYRDTVETEKTEDARVALAAAVEKYAARL